MGLSERMRDEARGLGLCNQWYDEWGSASKADLARKFIDGLDFCIANDWPSVDVIKRDFGDVIHDFGIYADESVHINGEGTIVLNGCCGGSVSFSDIAVGNLYVRHGSDVRVYVKGFAYVHISVYDNASVTLFCGPTAKCFVYRYGGNVRVVTDNVVIRERTVKK